jgi:predicted metal-dependent hydrolase
MEFPVIIERSRRKSLSLSITKDLQVLVKAPYLMKNSIIKDFIAKNEGWIESRMERQGGINALKEEYSSSTSAGRAKRKALLEALTQRTLYWAEIMEVNPSEIRLSSAEKRFGSCNSKGEISYSVILAHFSEREQDAVIVHELAHLKEMNHGKRFYEIVLKAMPDYRKRINNLKQWSSSEL